MVRKVCYVVLIVALLASAQPGTGAPDWVTDLINRINEMNYNLQEQMRYLNQHLQQQIQNSLQPALEQVYKTVENLPKDAQGRIITTSGNVISVNSVNGMSKTVMSGRTPDGEPYVRIIEEQRDGNWLYHNESSYNPRTNVTESIRWKLDLNTPGAKPEIIAEK